jgi:threonine dehydratase
VTLVTPRAIEQAASLLRTRAVRTPMLRAPWMVHPEGGEAWLKCEGLQHAGVFKFRGAYTMLARLDHTVRRRGVVTHSSGNHAQAVAYAARLFQVPCLVVMPTAAAPIKVDGARRLGAEVVQCGVTSLQIERHAEALASERNLTMVPPFDHPDVIAGQGTVGLEMLQDVADLDAIVVPIGGGGLISGIAGWIKRQRPECRVIGVEPEGADAMRRSVEAGLLVTLDSAATIADGLRPLRPSDLTLAHVQALADEVITVTDAEILAATRRLFLEAKLVVEFSGAAAAAALLAERHRRPGRVAAVLSGGNIDPAAIALLFDKPEAIHKAGVL